MVSGKRIKSVLLLLFSICLLSGCWDDKEIEGMYYIHSIGVDYVDDKFVVYGQVANFAGEDGGMSSNEAGGASASSENAKVVIGRGDTGVAAIHNFYLSSQRRIYWGHLSSVVFHERALKANFKSVLDDFSRFNEIRPTLFIFMTDQPLEDILTTLPPSKTSVLYSFLGDPIESYRQSSRVPKIRKHHFQAELTEPGKNTIIPNVTIVKKRWKGAEEYEPNLYMNGAGFIQNESFRGLLKDEKINGLVFTDKKATRIPIVIKKDGKPVATEILAQPQMKVTPIINGNNVTFKLELTVKGSVIELLENVSASELKKKTEKEVERQLQHLFENGLKMDADIFNLSYHLYKKDPKKWREFTTKGELPLTESSLESIEVKAAITHSNKEKLKFD
ncbi:Ger(x)C family spore germination protein [Alteribacillus sp. HJP-4]|uniref:Ger(x)C family spore germination protein n=1 Tax=Alteribacillus sp. HJP-4 TaxID=2775394 RepID=UPI0035CCE947